MQMELTKSKSRFTAIFPVILAVGLVALITGSGPSISVSALPQKAEAPTTTTEKPDPTRILYKTVKIEGLDIFYREAGPQNAPTILLLHGFLPFRDNFKFKIRTVVSTASKLCGQIFLLYLGISHD